MYQKGLLKIEMTYNGTLVMPANYAVVNEEEMTYVDGGWCIENQWWGYNIYLTHKERQAITSGQYIAALVAGLASYGVGSLIIGTVASIIWNYDDGYGVRIRMTGLKANAICTGVYALTKKQQKNIASKNKIIW